MSLSLPLYLLLIPYGIFLLVFAFYAFFNLFQLFRHGLDTFKTRALGVIFCLCVTATLLVTWSYAADVDWNAALTFDTIPQI